MFSKTLESAFSAMALLAETYQDDGALTADQIAELRQLNKPFVSKLLTLMVQAGLVQSKPGRNGGFSLAQSPRKISLYDVSQAVGHKVRIECCPFGPEYGVGNHCPMHNRLLDFRDQICGFLKDTTLSSFCNQKTTRSVG